MLGSPLLKPRNVIALALLVTTTVLGYTGVISSEIVTMMLVTIAGGYGFTRRRQKTTSSDSDER